MKFATTLMETLMSMYNFFLSFSFLFFFCSYSKAQVLQKRREMISAPNTAKINETNEPRAHTLQPVAVTLDSVEYDQRCTALSNDDKTGKWPVKTSYPKAGAVLPF